VWDNYFQNAKNLFSPPSPAFSWNIQSGRANQFDNRIISLEVPGQIASLLHAEHGWGQRHIAGNCPTRVTVWLADPLDTIWQIAFSEWVVGFLL
jgi:hypothetical protein